MGTPTAGLTGCEERVGQILPAERVDDALLCRCREARGQHDADPGLAELRDGLRRTGNGRDTVVDAGVVGRLEGAVGGLGTVLGSEQHTEHLDLGLTHRVQDVATGVVAFGSLGCESDGGGRDVERVQHESVVGDGGSGHVEDDEFDVGAGVRGSGVRHEKETAVWYRPLRGTRVNDS